MHFQVGGQWAVNAHGVFVMELFLQVNKQLFTSVLLVSIDWYVITEGVTCTHTLQLQLGSLFSF